jgi:acyl-CoA thioester hydrolase
MSDTQPPFTWPLRVYWEDTDAGGIVFYANYLKFMERARTEWLRALGVEQRALRERSGGMFVVSETQLKYHRPARLDDELLATVDLQQIGTASLIIGQCVLLKEEQNTRLCEGTIRIGWVDAHTLRPARIPAEVAGTLGPHLGSMSSRIAPRRLSQPL